MFKSKKGMIGNLVGLAIGIVVLGVIATNFSNINVKKVSSVSSLCHNSEMHKAQDWLTTQHNTQPDIWVRQLQVDC